MVLVAPETYHKYITTGPKGEPLLFVRLQKALYGMLKSALLIYKKLATNLVVKGFKINPYDPCVAFKEIDGWHVDDLKISHKNKMRVDEIEEWLKRIYGKVTVSKGKKHTITWKWSWTIQLQVTARLGWFPTPRKSSKPFPRRSRERQLRQLQITCSRCGIRRRHKHYLRIVVGLLLPH
jgi:hypothetical protein